MRKIKKMGALITAAALTVTLIGAGADASAFSKTKYGFTLSGDHSISKILQEQEIPQELIGVIQSLVENPLVLRQNGQVFIRKKL